VEFAAVARQIVTGALRRMASTRNQICQFHYVFPRIGDLQGGTLTALPPPSPSAMPPWTRSLRYRRCHGHALAESLCALLVVSVGLIPLASLGTTALARLRGHEQLAQAMRAAAEFAETAELDAAPMNRSDPVSDEGCPLVPGNEQSSCPRGGKLAIARLAIGEPGSAAILRGIVLWIRP
jgi:hypothetical protein